MLGNMAIINKLTEFGEVRGTLIASYLKLKEFDLTLQFFLLY